MDELTDRIAEVIWAELERQAQPFAGLHENGIDASDSFAALWASGKLEMSKVAAAVVEELGLTKLTGELREREPLRNDQWVKGYHAALYDLENGIL